jgi:hypothetical protein
MEFKTYCSKISRNAKYLEMRNKLLRAGSMAQVLEFKFDLSQTPEPSPPQIRENKLLNSPWIKTEITQEVL